MYLFCHLAAGLIVGIALFWYFRDPVLIVAAALGGILPDLIDKPLGHIILKNTLDYGRIYGHGLVFFLVLFGIGLLVRYRYHSFAGIALALGVLSHQLLDLMWLEPANWYYPLLGPFQPEYSGDFFIDGVLREVTNPSEWLFAAVVLVILIGVLASGRFACIERHPRLFTGVSAFLIALVTVAGVIILFSGGEGIGAVMTGLNNPADVLLAGGVMVGIGIMAGSCLIRERQCRI
jgi:hypothetical protein